MCFAVDAHCRLSESSVCEIYLSSSVFGCLNQGAAGAVTQEVEVTLLREETMAAFQVIGDKPGSRNLYTAFNLNETTHTRVLGEFGALLCTNSFFLDVHGTTRSLSKFMILFSSDHFQRVEI